MATNPYIGQAQIDAQTEIKDDYQPGDLVKMTTELKDHEPHIYRVERKTEKGFWVLAIEPYEEGKTWKVPSNWITKAD